MSLMTGPRWRTSRRETSWPETWACHRFVYPIAARRVSAPASAFISDRLRHPLNRADQPYIPPTKPYELSALAADLVVLARYLLNPGGRLVFFLPTVIDEYKELDMDSMLCDGMEIVANSLQDFGAWGRRVRSESDSRPFSILLT